MDKVVHFEIPAENVERAKKFYSSIFNWNIADVPPEFGVGYSLVHTGEVDEKQMPKESGAINGGMFKRADDLKNPVIIINVEDVDDSMEKIKGAGGVIVREKRKVGDMGYVAYFKDTEGNVLGVWENAKKE